MKIFTLILLLACSNLISAQDKKMTPEAQAAYIKAINQRAEKIVVGLELKNKKVADKVSNVIAKQYSDLNDLHSARDAKVKKLKADSDNKSIVEEQVKKAEDETQVAISKLHKKYLKKLSAHLTAQQVDQVKDGMTYGVVPITYKGYVDMIPSLTEPQKQQILTWLIEAREIAMDAETSDKKHWWFGKYKGKINNYLSAQGYDTAKEREEWNKRIKAKENATKN